MASLKKPPVLQQQVNGLKIGDSDDQFVSIHDGEERSASLKQNVMKILQNMLKRYVDFMASPVRQDHGLKLLQFTLWFLSQRQNASETWKKGLEKLSFDISFARYANRLLGFPMALEAAVSDSWTDKTSKRFNRLFRYIGRLLAYSMVGYYPLENLAYLQWMVPSLSKPQSRSAERLSAWSCRCWVIYIVSESLQNILQMKEIRDDKLKALKDGQDVGQLDARLRHLSWQLTRNALYLLPAIHFSLPNWDRQPWMKPKWVNGLFLAEAVAALMQSI